MSDPLTLSGIAVVGLTSLAAVYPKLSTYLAERKKEIMPHDAVKTLVDYFTAKKCSDGVRASVAVGKLLYEECTNHLHDDEVNNNLPA